MDQEQLLSQLGLSQNEIKVYFGLLTLGTTTTTPLVRAVKIPISKIYPTLEKLLHKGLVSYIIKNNVKYFQATDPEKLLELIGNKQKDLLQQKQQLEKLIPQLKLKQQETPEKEEATIYEGIKGLETVYDDLLRSMEKGDEYYVINLHPQDNYQRYQLFYRKYHMKRDAKGVHVHILTHTSQKKLAKTIFKGLHHCSLRFTSEALPSSMLIYKNKVATLLLREDPVIIVVESQQNTQQYKHFFQTLWKQGKK
ncbi:hypothetical protein HYY69_07645 [Candidatus Woesearchaeota archaeon]|nr:hypothetical protein [Candidatus Woesearchaeota archaeon]